MASAADNAALAARIRNLEFFSAPGVFELISARIADRMDFPALYMTGYGTVASYLGLPDAGLATYSDMIDRVTRICEVAKTPLIADDAANDGEYEWLIPEGQTPAANYTIRVTRNAPVLDDVSNSAVAQVIYLCLMGHEEWQVAFSMPALGADDELTGLDAMVASLRSA